MKKKALKEIKRNLVSTVKKSLQENNKRIIQVLESDLEKSFLSASRLSSRKTITNAIPVENEKIH